MRIKSAMTVLSLVAACGTLAVAPRPAQAQEDYRAIVTIMRACSQIADLPARVMCYDNNIRAQPGATVGASVQGPQVAPSVAPPGQTFTPPTPPQASAAAGFGSEMLPSVREAERAQEDEAVNAQVAAIAPLEPGLFLVTLADGAQWRFVDAAPSAWNPPRPGDEVELERGSLGSVFLAYDGQRRLRVRRVR